MTVKNKPIATIIDAHTILVFDRSQFDIAAILHSGQVFRYFETPSGYLVLAGANWASVCVPENATEPIRITCDDAQYFFHYFDLQTDYNLIKTQLAFTEMPAVIQAGGGIRILAGDWVEVVISFIISANNNIKRFSKSLKTLCATYGQKIKDGEAFAFPTLSELVVLSQQDWQNLGTGYRAPYLVKAVQQLAQLDYQRLAALPNSELGAELLKIAGVGPKVAACIMLFAFRRYNVVPVDTWIKKALAQLSTERQDAIFKHPYAGVMQQYIFYYLQFLHHNDLA